MLPPAGAARMPTGSGSTSSASRSPVRTASLLFSRAWAGGLALTAGCWLFLYPGGVLHYSETAGFSKRVTAKVRRDLNGVHRRWWLTVAVRAPLARRYRSRKGPSEPGALALEYVAGEDGQERPTAKLVETAPDSTEREALERVEPDGQRGLTEEECGALIEAMKSYLACTALPERLRKRALEMLQRGPKRRGRF